MSGGIAYVIDEDGTFDRRCHPELIQLSRLEDPEEIEWVKGSVFRHAEYTRSARATQILLAWDDYLTKFLRVIPEEYQRVIEAQRALTKSGLTAEEAALAAFVEEPGVRYQVPGVG
jgi:glutamate synthase domain-containing protein 3